jgi:tryptophan synthase beta chain
MDLLQKPAKTSFQSTNLEKRLDTPAKMYYKSEFFSPTGSHKVNTALAQCWYAKQQGFEMVTTETGAGQWGTALAYGGTIRAEVQNFG